MTLYDQSISFYKKARKAKEDGDTKKARELLSKAIKKMKILRKTSPDMLNGFYNQSIKEMTTLMENLRRGPENRSSARSKSKSRSRGQVSREDLPSACAKGFLLPERPDLNFSDVAGFQDLKEEIRETLNWQLEDLDLLEKYGVEPIKGIFFFGPPGCGKTYFAKAVAGEFSLPFVLADSATIMSKYVGEAEEKIRDIFACARKIGPAIIFFDEADSLFPKKSHGSDASQRVEGQLRQEMDGVKPSEGFIIFMATNEPWNIPPPLYRPERMDKRLFIGPPDNAVRKALFKLNLKEVPLEHDVSYTRLAKKTSPNSYGHYSAGGIKQICNEAKKEFIREIRNKEYEIKLSMNMLEQGIEKVKRGIPHDMVERYKDWKPEW